MISNYKCKSYVDVHTYWVQNLGNPKTLQMVHCLCKQWFLLAPTVGRTTHYPTNAKVCGGVGGYFGGNMITS